MKVKIYKNSTGGYTVKWPSLENSGLYHEKHFTPAVGYKCRHDIGASKFEIQLAIEIRRLAKPEVPLTGDALDKWLIRDILVEVGSSYV